MSANGLEVMQLEVASAGETMKSHQRISSVLAQAPAGSTSPDLLDLLIQARLDDLPMPAAGFTLERWQALVEVARFDLSLAKQYEGHTDALAIIGEIGGNGRLDSGSWGVWAAEVPHARAIVSGPGDGSFYVNGAKAWCSGATTVQNALLTAWSGNDALPQLVAVRLDHKGVTVHADQWKAVGMAGSQSVNVTFDNVPCTLVGKTGAYLERPGFWQGGAGVAACWLGGALGIASTLQQAMQRQAGNSGFKLASLGKVHLAVSQTVKVLRSAASWIDAHPAADASCVALEARLCAEQCAKTVLDEVGKAMGASPFCLNEKFARAAADLPVFIRQSHAEKDFAALGERAIQTTPDSWVL